MSNLMGNNIYLIDVKKHVGILIKYCWKYIYTLSSLYQSFDIEFPKLGLPAMDCRLLLLQGSHKPIYDTIPGRFCS